MELDQPKKKAGGRSDMAFLAGKGIDGIVDVYQATLKTLQAGISQHTNLLVSALSLMAYVDLLHGGCYTQKGKLPYSKFIEEEGSPLFGSNDPKNIDYWNNRVSYYFNKDVKRRFPKLLSDEVYEKVVGYCDQFLQKQEIWGNLQTGLGTLVITETKGGKEVSELTTSALAGLLSELK